MLMMLPFEAPTIFEGIHKSYFRMPRVVKDQRSRFDNDDLFRQLSHESAVKYTGFKDRPLVERQNQFITDCYLGHTEVSVVQSGNQFTLMFTPPTANPAYEHEGCLIDSEQGKAHIKAGFILNGVCVLWRGWIDLKRLEGFGCLEFDANRACFEDAMARQQADGKQPMCNNNLNAQPPPPLGRLNHHHLAGSQQVAPVPPMDHSAAAAAVAAAAAAAATTNSMLPPVGLNSSCLTATSGSNGSLMGNLTNGQGPPQAPQAAPPVSLAESAAAHYGNAAIAAAAAAAFHQALSAAPGGVPPSLNGLHGLGGGAPPQPQAPAPHSLLPQHLAYTPANGSPPHHQHQTSPQHLHNHHHFLNNALHQATNGHHNHHTKSPERENQQQQQQNSNTANNNSANQNSQQQQQGIKRQPSKRHHEDLGQTDEVDVVSDISVHELDFPPRRIFKTEQSIASHNLHTSHHKISRRAA